MPQKICITSATFQKCINFVLGDLKTTCILVYLDNLNVYSRTFNNHLKDLKKVFN